MELEINLSDVLAEALREADPEQIVELRRWCVEQGNRCPPSSPDANLSTPERAQKIYDWVTKG